VSIASLARFRTPRRIDSRRGQALVEFALVVPMFLLLLFVIIEGGRFILYYETLNNATREGARYAIVNGANTIGCPSGPPALGSSACDVSGNNVITRVSSAAFGVLGSGVTVTPTWHDPADNGRGSTVTVTATYTYTTIIPVPLPPITVSAESSLVINN
jgi:Flp pilus assembly protein TadG